MRKPVIRAVGGHALYVELCREISLDCNRRVHELYYLLLEKRGELGVDEVVPAYTSVTLFYNPRKTSWSLLAEKVSKLIEELRGKVVFRPRRFRIPVVYGGRYGPDLEESARLAGVSVDEFVKIHTSREYVCYMLGFTPGFVYLGDVDERIAVPRLEKPRTRVPRGSVGIAGKQTGLYGTESPGGWRIVGRTPLRTFDPRRDPPIPIRPGDLVEFYEISEKEFRELEGTWIEEVS